MNMEYFEDKEGKRILETIVEIIQDNKDYLSFIDGNIGDGDHGTNMNKGFSRFREKYLREEIMFVQGLKELGELLFFEIGGSMGPIYGTIFMGMAKAGKGKNKFGIIEFTEMLEKGYEELEEIIEAKPGDKTIIDTLYPAINVLKEEKNKKSSFLDALGKMEKAAQRGMNATKDMKAKYGRSSRLGDRSIGCLDAGAVSCYLILSGMAKEITEIMEERNHEVSSRM